MPLARACLFIAALCLLFVDVAIADDWPAARPVTLFTAAADRFIRVLPGTGFGDLFGFRGAPTGPYATVEIYERQTDRSYRLANAAPLVNPVAPVHVLLAPDGSFITFDNWHNLGYGRVVAVYRPDGTLLKTYTLEDLYPQRDLATLPTSVSSRAWRCAPFVMNPDGRDAYTREYFGGEFLFNMRDGSFKYSPGTQKECAAPKT
jgi:hypothetical protein